MVMEFELGRVLELDDSLLVQESRRHPRMALRCSLFLVYSLVL